MRFEDSDGGHDAKLWLVRGKPALIHVGAGPRGTLIGAINTKTCGLERWAVAKFLPHRSLDADGDVGINELLGCVVLH